jgi:hypothetical protein
VRGVSLPGLGLLAALAGCAAPADEPGAPPQLAGIEQANAALRAAQAGVDPWNAPPRRMAPAPLPDAGGERALPVVFATPRGGAVREAAGLLGATAPMLQRAMGQPDLRRRDGEAEAWLYRGQTCMLDVVLYPDPALGRELRVAFAAARATGIERVPEHSCLAEITRAHQLVARARE